MWSIFCVVSRSVAGVPAALSHHSNVAFAVETVLLAKGVVKEFRWSNPHTWLYVMVDDGKGN